MIEAVVEPALFKAVTVTVVVMLVSTLPLITPLNSFRVSPSGREGETEYDSTELVTVGVRVIGVLTKYDDSTL